MKTININGSEYKIECVYATKRAFNKNIGVHLQMQVFKDGKQIDKTEIGGYAMEKIEEYIQSLV
ncbi:MAG: hypothetical protein PHW89_07935 [Sulfurimonas denitrificans]|nr:hypothetical protein [Sulfurimonas denitrificans]